MIDLQLLIQGKYLPQLTPKTGLVPFTCRISILRRSSICSRQTDPLSSYQAAWNPLNTDPPSHTPANLCSPTQHISH